MNNYNLDLVAIAYSLPDSLPRKRVPPSTLKIVPETQAPAREAKYNAAPAISSSLPRRPRGKIKDQ